MSFGSMIKASYMTSEKKHILLDVLGSLSPIRVIWKWDEDEVCNIIYKGS